MPRRTHRHQSRRRSVRLVHGDPAGGLVITRDGRVIATGAVAPEASATWRAPTRLSPPMPSSAGLQRLAAVLRWSALPGPHPRRGSAAHRRIPRSPILNLYMATEPEYLDASWVYSPSLA